MRTFTDRIAVVTGAAGGIGRAVAEALAERGCHLALADIDEEGLEETARSVRQRDRRASTHVVDVSNKDRMRAFAREAIAEHGAAHLLVNNAGVTVQASFLNHSLDDFEWLFGINFWGVVYGCKFFLPELEKADEAHIVNMSSILGILGVPLQSSYCASKFAVRGLSESLRAELSSTSVGVTSVHPGGVATRIMQSSRYAEADGHDELRRRILESFQGFLPPRAAAARILRGIERNEARVVITPAASTADALQRLSPRLMSRFVSRRWQRIVGES